MLTLASCEGTGDSGVFDLEQRFQGERAESAGPYVPADSFEMPELENIIVIGERFFATQMFEIFLNYRRYLGLAIQYEGIFYTMPWDGYDFHFVVRYTFGCCGNDGLLGFEVIMDGLEPLPDDTWVEVTGILEFDGEFLVLRAISITEMDERGAEVVF